jgi:hypothetical protein
LLATAIVDDDLTATFANTLAGLAATAGNRAQLIPPAVPWPAR